MSLDTAGGGPGGTSPGTGMGNVPLGRQSTVANRSAAQRRDWRGPGRRGYLQSEVLYGTDIEITDQSGLPAMDVWSSHSKRTNYQASLGKENWVEH